MLRTALALATILGALGATAPAHALPIVDRGDLQRHCTAKYSPRGIQAVADPFTQPLVNSLVCRLPGRTFGFVNDNQSPAEVCATLTGSSAWANANGRVHCTGTQASRPGTIPAPAPVRPRNCNWVRVGAGFVCR